eukprot:547127_1
MYLRNALILAISFLLFYSAMLYVSSKMAQIDDFISEPSDTFLDHINDYGLKLMQLNASNSTESLFVHPQNTHYHLHYEFHLLKSILCWSEKTGIGNVLAQYWGARAIAYFLNYDFEWNICTNDTSYFPKYNDTQKYFSSFLPKHKHIYHKSEFAQNLMLYADRRTYNPSYMFTCSLLFVYYNKYYAHIMKNGYENAFKKYYESNNKSDELHALQHQFNTDGDIVIHIRCGDVFEFMSMDNNKLPEYGFLTANYMKYSVTNATKIAFNIDWIEDKISENTTIFILSQLTSGSLRGHERKYAKQCSYLIKYMVKNSFSLFFKPAKIEIMYDTDINNDFYLMMNAPLLICSPSSFCLAAATANTDGYVIMPSYGSWKMNLNDITNITKNYSDVYSNDMIVKHSKYLPQKHVIVESLKTKWHINNFKDYGYQIENLSKYLVDH